MAELLQVINNPELLHKLYHRLECQIFTGGECNCHTLTIYYKPGEEPADEHWQEVIDKSHIEKYKAEPME